MLAIQGTGRIKSMAGRKSNGTVIEKISGLKCPRKHMINQEGWKIVKKSQHLFAFVSSPDIYRQEELRNQVKGWCHALRDSSKLPKNVPNILLPESDFLDSRMVLFKPHDIRYDYFYFTINGKAGLRHKGLSIFLDILPYLCKRKLRGLVIVYFPNVPLHKKFTVKLSKHHREMLSKYERFLTFHWGILKPEGMNRVMTNCKFGLFPNTVDNSPRLISESLIRNVPVMMNKYIDGGWHYINKHTGALFDKSSKKSVLRAIDFMLENKFKTRDYYESHYGFDRSSKKLAQFLNGLFGFDYTHMYFNDFRHYLREIK
ncbi:hypothetical protein LCGC14_0891860 [marine sediment metagenome]|uniref:Glycosyl transferase family 1 domain-containing protein n=1 Tax=marine sediment metagenome TaxID=412755 RepID=A0A0F9P3U2_9ZZZZ